MQRLYSTFPGAGPGIGLLLLRGALGMTLIMQSTACLSELQNLSIGAALPCLLALVVGGSLIVGFLTPVLCALVALVSLAVTFFGVQIANWSISNGSLLGFDLLLMAVACILLGPGAFSVDAHLFGRRKVIIPRASPSRPPEI